MLIVVDQDLAKWILEIDGRLVTAGGRTSIGKMK
jgi:hypothetical protein